MRKFLIAGNWKMHGSSVMTAELVSGITESLEKHDQSQTLIDVLICPAAPYLAGAAANIGSEMSSILLGAQNVNEQQQGAYTGEVSLAMLSDIGCDFVLLGHSERRELYGETDELVATKFAACIEYASQHEGGGVIPVLCVGESLEQRQSGDTQEVVGAQINAVLEQVGVVGFEHAVIAYEPVWAIGTGETATPEQAQQVHAFIRQTIAELDEKIASKLRILYGGSMKAVNAKELLAQADIDGGLIGGASLQADSFSAICTAAIELS